MDVIRRARALTYSVDWIFEDIREANLNAAIAEAQMTKFRVAGILPRSPRR